MKESPRLSLPEASKEQQSHSNELLARICQRIRESGPLPFADYMQAALYEPGFGYYVSGQPVFGDAGDFQTSPMVGSLFAECIARQCMQVLDSLHETAVDDAKPTAEAYSEFQELSTQPLGVLEFGAGNGDLAAVVYEKLCMACTERGVAPPIYHILETSAVLRQRQQQRLQHLQSVQGASIEWHTALPDSFAGMVIANEVLDAMPVERIRWQGGRFEQMFVATPGESEENCLLAEFQPLADDLAAGLLRSHSVLLEQVADGYVFEWNRYLPGWFKALADTLNRGAVVLVDYGYPRREYLLPERSDGTLMCYLRHHAHDDPFHLPGVQDITAHVDFTAVAEAGDAAGFELNGYSTQAAFLKANGLLDIAAERVSNLPRLDLADERITELKTMQEVKTLTLPGSMGERFQVIGFSRGLDFALQGFTLEDLSHRL